MSYSARFAHQVNQFPSSSSGGSIREGRQSVLRLLYLVSSSVVSACGPRSARSTRGTESIAGGSKTSSLSELNVSSLLVSSSSRLQPARSLARSLSRSVQLVGRFLCVSLLLPTDEEVIEVSIDDRHRQVHTGSGGFGGTTCVFVCV